MTSSATAGLSTDRHVEEIGDDGVDDGLTESIEILAAR